MEFKNKQNQVHTTIEGKKVWDSRSVATNTVILMKDKHFSEEFFVLAAKRGEGAPDFNGLWNLPAGYLDKNETTSEGAIREINEETYVNVLNLVNLKEDLNNFVVKEDIMKEWNTNSNPSNNNETVSFRFGICVVMEKFFNKIALSDMNSEPDEIGELAWIPLSELDNYEWAFGHDKQIREYYDHIIG